MDYKFKFLKYKIKSEKLEKKIYEYIEKNNIDIKKVYSLMNNKKNIKENNVVNDLEHVIHSDVSDTNEEQFEIKNIEEENIENNNIMLELYNDFK